MGRGLTIGRFAATPLFLYLFVDAIENPQGSHLAILSLLYLAIALSDLLDGFFARLGRAASQRWAKLDALSDILFNTLSLFIASWFGLVGVWIPLGIVVLAAAFAHRNRRIAVQRRASSVAGQTSNGRDVETVRLSEDRLGKAAGVLYYLFVGAVVSSLWFRTEVAPIVIWWLGNVVFVYTLAVIVRNLRAQAPNP